MATCAKERLDVFGLGIDKDVWHKGYSPSTGWQDWESLGCQFQHAPVVASCGEPRRRATRYHGHTNGQWTLP